MTHPLVSWAENGNLDYLNGAWNGLGLPDNMAHSVQYNLPMHLGPHNTYTAQVWQLLDIEMGRLSAANPGGISVIDAQMGVSRVAAWARGILGSVGGGCTVNQVDLQVGSY